jgi:peroxiredoxin Q/BCP
MPYPTVGAPAPDFALASDRGGIFRLSAQRGKPVVLVFYPEDGSGGCIVENREFSALLPEFEALGAVVVGISPQDVASHCRFRDRHELSQPLLADPELVAIKAYGLWAQKKMFGHEFMGVVRVTFLVDADGRIAGSFRATRIKGHAQRVLEALRALPR